MSTYTFEVPVVVYHTSDEHENMLATNKSITDFVLQHLRNSWREYFPNSVIDCQMESSKDRLTIKLGTESTTSDDEESSKVMGWLSDWMRWGYFDSGLTLPGRYYKYPYDEISVHTWDAKLPITLKRNIAPEETNG